MWMRSSAARASPRRMATQPAPAPQGWQEDRHDPPKRKRRKKRKGFLREMFEEAFDVLEDIFD
jgi:hypothetical protein